MADRWIDRQRLLKWSHRSLHLSKYFFFRELCEKVLTDMSESQTHRKITLMAFVKKVRHFLLMFFEKPLMIHFFIDTNKRVHSFLHKFFHQTKDCRISIRFVVSFLSKNYCWRNVDRFCLCANIVLLSSNNVLLLSESFTVSPTFEFVPQISVTEDTDLHTVKT